MSSSLSNPVTQNERPYKGLYTSIVPYVGPPVGAGLAIIPVFHGFRIKSALQIATSSFDAPVARAFLYALRSIPKHGIEATKQLFQREVVFIAQRAGIPYYSVLQTFAHTTSSPVVVPTLKGAVEAVQNIPKMGVSKAKMLFQERMRTIAQEAEIPKMQLSKGVDAACTIGAIVGLQMLTESCVKEKLGKWFPQHKESPGVMLLSAMIVGIVSFPLLAVFNGLTMKGEKESFQENVTKSLKGLSFGQAWKIVGRESTFVFSLNADKLVNEKLKSRFGTSKKVEYLSAAISGVVGSYFGHPFDALLTFDQKGIPVKSAPQLMRGATSKAISLAGFAVCYKAVNECIKSTAE